MRFAPAAALWVHGTSLPTHHQMRVLYFAVRLCLAICVAIFPSAPALGQKTAPVKDLENSEQAIARLGQLGYWTEAKPATSSINRQAIVAFQKVSKLPRTGRLSESVIRWILESAVPYARDSMHALHVEIDLNRQVLFVVDSEDLVSRILPVSTGNGKYFETPELGGRYALTPRGHFRVYLKISGWHKSTLGLLFDPLYVRGGVAIHGARDVPAIPASHGCIRIPLFAAEEMFRRTPIGTPVVIFGENPKIPKPTE